MFILAVSAQHTNSFSPLVPSSVSVSLMRYTYFAEKLTESLFNSLKVSKSKPAIVIPALLCDGGLCVCVAAYASMCVTIAWHLYGRFISHNAPSIIQ